MTKIFEILGNVTPEEWRIFIGIAVGLCALTGYIGHEIGRFRGWSDRRHSRDRDNVIEASVILRPLPDGRTEFAIETEDQLPTITQVFGNPHLEAKVRTNVPRCMIGGQLLPPGRDHYLAMERAGIHVTGPDPVATQSAMFHREGELHADLTAFMLTCAVGEDGITMPHLIKASPDDLLRMADPDFVARLVPFREVHGTYIPIVQKMSAEYAKSHALFVQYDERRAGERAGVWTTMIRTQKALTEDQVRAIAENMLKGGELRVA